MKRKFIFIIGMMLLASSQNADAACVATDKSYTACKPGYYLNNGVCSACPESGTSADRNKTGITECYLPSGTTGNDATGSFEYTNDCHYNK
ncbi:MAG TPA: hypothetical protein DD611_00975 [Alphaproteobacteria bacterium]|nr:hypothetical protein [Alphaproteobacteria bacterium]